MKTTMKKFAATTLAGLALAGAFAVSTGVQDVKANSEITLTAPKTTSSKADLKKTADELEKNGFKYLTNYGYDLADYYGSLFGTLEAEYDIYLGADLPDGVERLSEEDYYKKLDENLKEHAKTKNEIRTNDDYNKVIASIY